MQLNPVFNYIKSKKTFSFIDVVKHCQDKVVDTFYIRSAFLYMANGAMIKQVNEPMPNKVRTKLAKIINDIFADELNYEDVYEYRVYECNKETCKWTNQQKTFEMFKMYLMIISETENMC